MATAKCPHPHLSVLFALAIGNGLVQVCGKCRGAGVKWQILQKGTMWSRGVARWVRWNLSVAGPFVCRCLTSSTMLPFPHPAHRTGRADLPHPALGEDSRNRRSHRM